MCQGPGPPSCRRRLRSTPPGAARPLSKEAPTKRLLGRGRGAGRAASGAMHGGWVGVAGQSSREGPRALYWYVWVLLRRPPSCRRRCSARPLWGALGRRSGGAGAALLLAWSRHTLAFALFNGRRTLVVRLRCVARKARTSVAGRASVCGRLLPWLNLGANAERAPLVYLPPPEGSKRHRSARRMAGEQAAPAA